MFGVPMVLSNGILQFLILMFFTFAKKVMFSPGAICLSVCLFVNKITQKLREGF